MAKLTDAVKREVVQRLARWEDPSDIRKAIKETHGIDLSPQQITYYNPDSSDTDVAQKWRNLYDETRERFLHDSSDIFVSKKTARLRELQDLYLRAKKRGALKLAMEILEQVSKEQGGMFKNKNLPQPAAPPAPLRIEEETDDERRTREAAAAASYDRQRRGELSEDDAA